MMKRLALTYSSSNSGVTVFCAAYIRNVGLVASLLL